MFRGSALHPVWLHENESRAGMGWASAVAIVFAVVAAASCAIDLAMTLSALPLPR